MKHAWKRWTSGLLVLALLLSFVPVIPKTAEAAAASFFYPDNQALAALANQPIPATGKIKGISYLSTNKLLTITGTFTAVSSDSVKVTVDQMVNIGSGTENWQPDPTRTFTKAVTTIGTRFEAPNLQLFNGYNKVTISGTQNGTVKADVFYVLYEDVPYLKSIKLGAGSDEPFDLNEGAARIVKKPATTDPSYKMMVYIQGQAVNATKVVLNGNLASPTEDGLFFAPPLQLVPGKNDIKIVLSNDSNTVELVRTVYYYDDTKPFIDVSLDHDADGVNSVFTGSPILTDDAPTDALIKVSMLVPYQNLAFADYTTVTADVYSSRPDLVIADPAVPATKVTVLPADEIIVYGKTGTPEFKFVTFTTTSPYPLINSNTTPANPEQEFDIKVEYGTAGSQFTAYAKKLHYKYYPGSVKIKDVKLVKDYGTASESKVELDKSEVSDSTFYVEVTTDKDITGKTLGVKLLPYNTTTVDISPVATPPSGTTVIYKITNFPSGTQQLEFSYDSSLSSYVATVSFISKSYISVDNLYDGQVITIDTNATSIDSIFQDINGSFVNFNNMIEPQLTVNGVSISAGGTAPYFNVSGDKKTFAAKIGYTGSGAFFYGENHITIRAKNTIGTTTQLIEKELRIYIVDKNVPNVAKFKPLEIAKDNSRPDLDANVLEEPLKEIRLSDDKYYTKLKVVDLAIRGSGADTVKVSKAGDTLITIDTATHAGTINPSMDAEVDYDNDSTSWEGTRDDFIIRLKNIQVPETGSYVYTVELRNSAGARITQRLEIVREVADVVIWSPKETVGDRIVVNKNFVLFDVEAEGADSVTVDGKPAAPRPDIKNRFTYNFIGLKQDKEQTIKVTVTRPGGAKTVSVKVLFTGPVEEGSQYMEKLSTKHNVFNGGLNLTFPKGTVLKTANPELTLGKTPKFYDRNNLFFGIASPQDGVVERVNDYGQIKSVKDSRTWKELSAIIIDSWLSDHFTNPSKRDKFTTISPIYWISGGLGESKGLGMDKEAVDGQDPYSVEGTFTKYAPERKIVPTNRGQLTLKFNGSIVDAAGTIVTVYFFNDQGEWKNLGGVVDTKKNTITVPFEDFGYYMVAKLKEGYADVTNHPWARNILEALYAKGMMENARYDEFGTDDYITRGEFTTLLVRALNLPLNYDNNNTFFDVYEGTNLLWKYPEIETAARAGIVTGLENRYFGVNLRITRGQAATMIARALDLKMQLNDSKLAANLQKAFSDYGVMSGPYHYALPAIDAVSKAKIMVGSPDAAEDGKKPTVHFGAEANMTRAQAGAIVVRLLKKTSTIFPKNFDDQ